MNSSPHIQLGTDDFADLLLNSDVFVDKSLFVKEFLETSSKTVLITRPRRWGKSLNMSMIEKFLAIAVDEQGQRLTPDQSLNRKLFMGGEITLNEDVSKQLSPLKIAVEERIMSAYLGQYPVISLGLKNVKGSSYEEIVLKLRQEIRKVFLKHAYLLKRNGITGYEQALFRTHLEEKGNESQIQDSLRFLSELLHKYFGQPVYILVDEYDTPVNSAYLKFYDKDREIFDQVIELFRELLGKAMKSNEYLKQGLITGILRIAKANVLSELNNVSEYTLLDKRFATAYGFTQAEVDELLDQVPTSNASTQEIQHWYNGYTFGGEKLYNPWSIMSCLAREGELDYYWIDSGGTSLIDEVLLQDKTQESLQKLASGDYLERVVDKKIVFDKLNSLDGLYSLLVFGGYLNAKAIDAPRKFYEISVPNYEVQYIYEHRILDWVEKKTSLSSEDYVVLAQFLIKGKVEEFQITLQDFLGQSASFYQAGSRMSEVFYSGFMLCLFSMLFTRYRIESEYESGAGKADVVLIPKSPTNHRALIIEYKVCKHAENLASTAQSGLAQILSKDYSAKAASYDHVREILAVSLAFCGKQLTVAHESFASR